MPRPDFDKLRNHLLEEGVAPRHVFRIISELSDHHEDLELEALQQGLQPHAASVRASKRIGVERHLAAQIVSRVELKCWVHRYPRLARLVLPVAYIATLPLAPVHAVVTNAPAIVRWCACLIASAIITGATLLVMQISIALS